MHIRSLHSLRPGPLLILACLVGCSQIVRVDPHNALLVSEDVLVTFDPFKGTTAYQGPVITNTADDGSDAPEVEDIALRAQQERDRPIRYYLTVTDYYDGDWRGFDQAYDLEGNKFHALSVRHKVNCSLLCGYEESIEVELSRKYLDDHRQKGITMRLYGPSGQSSAPFSIPPAYIEGFIKGSFSQ